MCALPVLLFQGALGVELRNRGVPVLLDLRLIVQRRSLVVTSVDPTFDVTKWASVGSRRGWGISKKRTLSGYRVIDEPQFEYWPGVFIEATRPRTLLRSRQSVV